MTYINLYPGLLHFIYVNHSNDTMIAPSMVPYSRMHLDPPALTTAGLRPVPGAAVATTIKELVWTLYSHSSACLSKAPHPARTRGADRGRATPQ